MLFKSLCLPNLRITCFIIGYIHLVVCVVDITVHVLIAAIVSSGFQCDVDYSILQLIKWTWLEPFLLVVNLGTHGFYPVPLILSPHSAEVDYMPIASQPRCYPGMLHLYLIDILNLLINVIWWICVANYISALHRKDPKPMRMFCNVAMLKHIFQVLYVAYQTDFYNTLPLEAYWLDVCVQAYFLYLIIVYTQALQAPTAREAEEIDQPPIYVEVDKPMASTIAIQDENKDGVLSIASVLEEQPIEVATDIV